MPVSVINHAHTILHPFQSVTIIHCISLIPWAITSPKHHICLPNYSIYIHTQDNVDVQWKPISLPLFFPRCQDRDVSSWSWATFCGSLTPVTFLENQQKLCKCLLASSQLLLVMQPGNCLWVSTNPPEEHFKVDIGH